MVPACLEEIEQPIVLVTTSSEFQGDGRLVQTTLAALADEPVFVVATVPAGDASAFRAPANARVERFVPHAAVLSKAVCAVTHAGMGATQKALARGVPVCAVPFGRDQLEVARRVEVAGAGARLPAKKLTPGALRAKVREAMGKADGARRIADAFAGQVVHALPPIRSRNGCWRSMEGSAPDRPFARAHRGEAGPPGPDRQRSRCTRQFRQGRPGPDPRAKRQVGVRIDYSQNYSCDCPLTSAGSSSAPASPAPASPAPVSADPASSAGPRITTERCGCLGPKSARRTTPGSSTFIS